MDEPITTMLCYQHKITYFAHKGCKLCDYVCNCGLNFTTLDDLSRHVSDNHKDRLIISGDIVMETKLPDSWKATITLI